MEKVIFWDLEGTLVHPNASCRDSLTAALACHGASLPENDIRAYLQAAGPWNHTDQPHPTQVNAAWWDAYLAPLAALCESCGISQAEAICRTFRQNILDFPYTPYPDAVRTLVDCRAKGYANIIISNNFPELGDSLARQGILPGIDACISSGAVGYEKPCPEVFRYARQLAGAPALCYMVGDNPATDIRGGEAGGMRTILVHHAPVEGVRTCQMLAEIPRIIE